MKLLFCIKIFQWRHPKTDLHQMPGQVINRKQQLMSVFGWSDFLTVDSVFSISVWYGDPEEAAGPEIPKAFLKRPGTLTLGQMLEEVFRHQSIDGAGRK